ncbi:MAG: class II glutamine amidotransferase [Thermoleophilia bacterium]|nr:class II glutamine amidotransferase [Thermoleophilia bacterium]
MCRWIAYSGSPLNLARILFEPKHSLVQQSLDSYEGAEATNGDGFGLGWYASGRAAPGRYRSVSPAWNDQNLLDLATHIDSHLAFAHVRATTGSPVQQTNCHPFAHDNWLFQHNGSIAMHEGMHRDLLLCVAPELFDSIAGSTDTELLFYLALSDGLADDPIGAFERTIGMIESMAVGRDIDCAVQGTFAVSDGHTLWVVRYSSIHRSRSLYYSQDIDTIRSLYPDVRLQDPVPDDARFVASEPFTDNLPGLWIEVPESEAIIVRRGEPVEHRPFVPVHAQVPTTA